MAAAAAAAAGDEAWCRETVPRVMELVSPRLPQRDACALLAVSPWCHRALVANPKLWEVLDLHEMNKAGDRLISAISLPRYCHLKIINLEFAQDIDDRHFVRLKEMGCTSLQELELLNINACQKVSDKGIETITSLCPNLRALSIYWIVGLTDLTIRHIVQNCKHIVDLNLSGCKNISDKGMQLVADNYEGLKKLNITRCIKLTDDGLQEVLQKCSSLESLNLYALSSFSDKVYKKIGSLTNLTFLDLCGAQNVTDDGLSCISRCVCLTYLNLSWCVRVTDVGVVAIAQGCRSLQLLSLFGIVGVTDVCLEALSKHCSRSLTTLDVNGCIGIKKRRRDDLIQLFPLLRCFKVHS
ncbi:F-box protein At3g58530 isoform X1 [Oryza glaberrima]|uniref:F-box protein At3g58530 isoform X1 n=2 Tax=Oryza glaberrima TaxID=4538 RepID=UPI00224C3AD7|nr:F-box protein At3g58530 isoform X1 [Oryza glaberrima]